MNNNLTDRAFPGTVDHDNGLTKHEYATLLFASGYISSSTNAINKDEQREAIAEECYELAKTILNKF